MAFKIRLIASTFLVFGLVLFFWDRPPSDHLYFKGSFSEADAMRTLFGNFESSKHISVWQTSLNELPTGGLVGGVASLFSGSSAGLAEIYDIQIPNPRTAYVFFTSRGNQTLRSVEDRSIRGPQLLGGAVFARQGSYWILSAKNLFLGVIGDYQGLPSGHSLREWSPGRYGLELVEKTDDPALSNEITSFFGFNGEKLSRIFSVETAFNDCVLLRNPDRAGFDADYNCRDRRELIGFIQSSPPPTVFDVTFRSNTKFRNGSLTSGVSHYVFRGNTYFDDQYGLPIDQHDRLAKAKDGDSASAFGLGCIFRDGQLGLPKDTAKAKYWFEQSAASKDSSPVVGDALSEIGAMYQHGWGVSVDLQKALDLFVDSDQRGSDVGAYNLGYSYHVGIGVAPDYEIAMKCYLRAVERGLPLAATAIGHMYQEGQGVPRDDAKASQWFGYAAEMQKARPSDSILQGNPSPEAMTGGDSRDIKSRYYEGTSRFKDSPRAQRAREEAIRELGGANSTVRQTIQK